MRRDPPGQVNWAEILQLFNQKIFTVHLITVCHGMCWALEMLKCSHRAERLQRENQDVIRDGRKGHEESVA